MVAARRPRHGLTFVVCEDGRVGEDDDFVDARRRDADRRGLGRQHGRGDRGRRPGARRRWAIGVIAASLLGLVWAGAGALFSVNPCGMFGDACDDVGATGQGFGWFVLVALACLVGAVVGVALLESSRPD